MQRLLVALVLVLLVAVAGLGIAVYNLKDDTPTSTRQPPSARLPSLPPEHDPAAAARLAEQERKIAHLEEAIAALKRESRERPQVPTATPAPTAGGGGTGEGGVVSAPGVRPRDVNGQLVITEEDVEHFSKVQERVLRQQRVDNQTRGIMLRIDRMAGRGEIQPFAEDRRRDVEKVLRKYVAAGDDLSARLLRQPDEERGALTSEQRRDELTQGRTQLVAEAQRELETLLGPDDAKKIADEGLQRPWGLGRQTRRFENDR